MAQKKSPNHSKKYYIRDIEKQFNIVYLQHNDVQDKRLLEWDIKKDREYYINPKLN